MELKEQLHLDSLVERLKHSDQKAYEEIFRLLHEPLLRYVCRITQDEGLALDVLQDVFMKLWEKRETLDVQISFKAFVYAMTRNRALNINRRQSRITYNSEMIADAQLNASGTVLEDKIHKDELDVFFKKWIKELPPRRAEAFVLSRFHAMSNREIGEIMGLSKRTVDTHIVHALRHLRRRYDYLRSN